MKPFLTLLILVITLTAFAQEFEFDYNKDYEKILAKTNDPTGDLYYNNLLTRFRARDTTMTDFEVLALLVGFTDNEHFKPYSYLTTEREIYTLNGNGKYKKALALCDSLLSFVPVSQQALIEKSYSFYKLGQADSSQYYMWHFRRIMEAMAQSGDGLTPETAFFSLGPADGQNFIRKFLASSIGTMGSGRDKHGNFVDILEAVSEDEETGEKRSRDIYFQIEHASKTMFDGLDLEKMMEELDTGEKENGKKKKKK